MYEITERQCDGVTVLVPDGPLTSSEGATALTSRLAAVTCQRYCKVLLDCARVSQIDSEGISALIKGLTSAEKRGGALKLLGLSPQVRKVLAALRVLQAFECFEDEDRALASFK